jgi:acyl-CoA synthetase (AMP-forming)/AMP-acid ligase II
MSERHAAAERWSLRTPAKELSRSYRAQKFWTDETLGDFADARLRHGGECELRIWSSTRPHRSRLRQERLRALQVAAGLERLGIRPGDVVAYQLPNWREAVECFAAIALLGAVLIPIVHFYGPKEVRFVLSESGARTFVTADQFGAIDYLAGLAQVRPHLPDLENVIVVGDRVPGDTLSFESLVAETPLPGPRRVDPDAPAVVAYTSGTTADPKGVIHSHRSLLAEVAQLTALQSPGRPQLVGAPVAHGIGMLSGLLNPLFRGQPIHLIDVWNPAAVLAAMRQEGLASGSGSTYFLTSLLDAPELQQSDLSLMSEVGLGGAPVPAAVADRVDALGISLIRSYGSTEHPSTTGSSHDEPAAKRKYTDGHPLPGVELKLLDATGKEVRTGEEGEIVSRGPDLFCGYTDPALTAETLSPDGWYRTGDVGVLDEDGYLTITDRLKDIIIRGGTNVSAAEVEELLMRMPGVAEVAVVAAPDPRLGEHGCAFFRMQAGVELAGLEPMRRHLEASGLAKQKWPEEIRSVKDFDRTPSGKVKKFALRDLLRSESAATSAQS